MRHKGQGDVTKLPVWAQDRILLLERNLEYANAKIAELSNMQTGGVVKTGFTLRSNGQDLAMC